MCHLILFLPIFGLAVFVLFPMSLALPLYAVIFLLSVAMYVLIVKAMRRPVVTGIEALLHSEGTVIGRNDEHWRILVGNESWDAASQVTLQVGEQVRVIGIDGLCLRVEPESTRRSPEGLME